MKTPVMVQVDLAKVEKLVDDISTLCDGIDCVVIMVAMADILASLSIQNDEATIEGIVTDFIGIMMQRHGVPPEGVGVTAH